MTHNHQCRHRWCAPSHTNIGWEAAALLEPSDRIERRDSITSSNFAFYGSLRHLTAKESSYPIYERQGYQRKTKVFPPPSLAFPQATSATTGRSTRAAAPSASPTTSTASCTTDRPGGSSSTSRRRVAGGDVTKGQQIVGKMPNHQRWYAKMEGQLE